MIVKPDSKFKITTDIKDLLLSDSEITEIIGNRIFPLIADADTEGTFIAYQRDRYIAETTKTGAATDECDVWLFIVSNDYDESLELAERVYYALVGDHEVNDRKFTGYLIDSTEECGASEAGTKYTQILLFKIE